MDADLIIKVNGLVNRLYWGEQLSYEQYTCIAMMAKVMAITEDEKLYKKNNGGNCIARVECWAETGNGPDFPCGIKLSSHTFYGYYYLGVWVRFLTDGSFALAFYPHGSNGVEKQLHIYPNGDVFEEHCIEDVFNKD